MIQVLVADGWPLFRQGIKVLLEETGDIRVVAEAEDWPQFCSLLRTKMPIDVAVADIEMSATSSMEPLRHALAIRQRLPVLVLSKKGHTEYAMRALKAGAAGYATKDSTAQNLVYAIHRLSAGGQYLSSQIAELVALQWRNGDSRLPPHSGLTSREFSVFEMLAQGRTGSQIASALCLSRKTVSSHKTRLLRKMNVTNLADLVRYAIDHRFFPGHAVADPAVISGE